jgi:hypothetical protein
MFIAAYRWDAPVSIREISAAGSVLGGNAALQRFVSGFSKKPFCAPHGRLHVGIGMNPASDAEIYAGASAAIQGAACQPMGGLCRRSPQFRRASLKSVNFCQGFRMMAHLRRQHEQGAVVRSQAPDSMGLAVAMRLRHHRCFSQRNGGPYEGFNQSCAAFDHISTIVCVIELSQDSWLLPD